MARVDGMGMLSSVYSSEAELLAAKRSREEQAKRNAKRDKRKAKRVAAKLRKTQNPARQKPVKANPFELPVYRAGMGKEFYQTRAWFDLRYAVLQARGAVCECCGASRKDGVRIHVDHIKPRFRFPHLELAVSNMQVLCEPCNMGKGSRYETDWRNAEPITQALVHR